MTLNFLFTRNVKPEQIKWTNGVTSAKTIGPQVVHTFFVC